MRSCIYLGLTALALASAAPMTARAHSFATPYTLPVPLWMYAYGGAATLILTFALLAYFRGGSVASSVLTTRPLRAAPVVRLAARWLLRCSRTGAVACLLLTIVAGFIGSDDPTRNISMTLFWAMFMLGFAYLELLAGNLYRLLNPWRTVIATLERFGVDLSTARFNYSPKLGSWPAFLLYMGLIYMELFEGAEPVILSYVLTLYSLLVLVGAAMFGAETYFAKVDVFTVYFRTIGKLAPVDYRRTADGHWEVYGRKPLSGALSDAPTHLGLVFFVIFMLSSTAYDSIHDTSLWVGLFWSTALSLWSSAWNGDLAKAQDLLMGYYLVYRWAGLLVFPFLYFTLYAITLWCARLLIRRAPPPKNAIYLFCYSLVPVAVAYNFSHYFTFLVTQMEAMPNLLSDPFGIGWRWLSLADASRPQLPMGIVWHIQVGAVLLGHIAGVYLVHRMAVQTDDGNAGLSLVAQLPLLFLMIGYTVFGLWILALPLG